MSKQGNKKGLTKDQLKELIKLVKISLEEEKENINSRNMEILQYSPYKEILKNKIVGVIKEIINNKENHKKIKNLKKISQRRKIL